MTSKTPTIKQTALISAIPQLIILGLIIYLSISLNPKNGVLIGAAIYLAISFSLRFGIARQHRLGMIKVKAGNYKDAIPLFEKSYQFFTHNEWIDRYRYITLLSSSRISYREMALNNIAFSYGQIGNGEQSIYYYKKTLSEFPESALAKTALNLIEAGRQVSSQEETES